MSGPDMYWPEWVMLVWMGLHLVVRMAKEGEPREGKYSTGMGIVDVSCWAVLLYFGGFFTGPNP